MEPSRTDWRELDSTRCSVARTAAVLGDGWTVLVLRDLFHGIRRFDELAAHLGVARNVLTRRLAGLTAAGVVRRVPYREPGARTRHEYRLTAAGRDLLPVVLAMAAWGDRHRRRRGRPAGVGRARRLRGPGAGAAALRRRPPPGAAIGSGPLAARSGRGPPRRLTGRGGFGRAAARVPPADG